MPDVPVTKDIANEIMKPVSGEGGYQDLMRKVQRNLTDGTLHLDAEDLEKIPRYAEEYGQGGFEERLSPLLSLLREQGLVPDSDG